MTETTPFLLHGSPVSGPTYKVALMLALCGQAFTFRSVDLRGGEQRTPAFLAKTPYGQVPVLEHGGRCFAQSAAILQYLAEVVGRFGGRDAAERAEIASWMFWEFDRLAPGIYRPRVIRMGIYQADPAVLAHFVTAGETALGLLERRLAGRDWIVGDAPTIADVDVYGSVAYVGDAGFDLAAFPAVAAWKAKVEALPGFGTAATLLAVGAHP